MPHFSQSDLVALASSIRSSAQNAPLAQPALALALDLSRMVEPLGTLSTICHSRVRLLSAMPNCFMAGASASLLFLALSLPAYIQLAHCEPATPIRYLL